VGGNVSLDRVRTNLEDLPGRAREEGKKKHGRREGKDKSSDIDYGVPGGVKAGEGVDHLQVGKAGTPT